MSVAWKTDEAPTVRIDPQRLMRLAVLINQGSFRKAANELGVTQPALSQSIAQLESEVGVKLIERTPHGIEPTIYGEAVYVHAKAIDWELAQAGQRIRELTGGNKGTLTIGASIGAAVYMVAQAICRPQISGAGFSIRVMEEPSTSALMRQLHERSLDLVICQTLSEFELKGARSTPLFRSRRLACVRAGHPLGKTPPLRELLSFPFACPLDEIGLLSGIRNALSTVGLEMPKNNVVVGNSIAVGKEVVRNSDAFAIFSDLSVWRELEAGDLVATALPEEAGQWYNLVTRSEYAGTASTKNFLQSVFETCEASNVDVHPDARRLERRIPRESLAAAGS
jgi:DNA-binding transcriptional LysR family regulator